VDAQSLVLNGSMVLAPAKMVKLNSKVLVLLKFNAQQIPTKLQKDKHVQPVKL